MHASNIDADTQASALPRSPSICELKTSQQPDDSSGLPAVYTFIYNYITNQKTVSPATAVIGQGIAIVRISFERELCSTTSEDDNHDTWIEVCENDIAPISKVHSITAFQSSKTLTSA